MIDLSVKFAGIDFRSPIGIAAHGPSVPRRDLVTPEVHMDKWRKYYEAGVGAITTGTIFFDEMQDARGSIRFCPISTKGFAERELFVTAATMPDCIWPRSPGLGAVEKAKKEFKDMRVIASIMGPQVDLKGWGDLALEAQQAGADALELNMGSVMMMKSAEKALGAITSKRALPAGAIIGLVPEVVGKIVKAIKKQVSVPIIIKVTPELGFFGLLGAIPFYKEAGVNGLVCDHSVMTIAPPDIYNGGATTHPHFKTTTWWSSCGPWNRQTCYRDVACVGKYAPDLDVEACGGLVIPENVIEVMMLGAKMVQLSAGIFFNGMSYPARVVKFFKRYMEEQGYKSLEDFRSLGLKYIAEMADVQAEYKEQVGKLIAHVDYMKCAGADACRECLETWCLATSEEDGEVKVNPDLCCGCNLCVIRCPNDARSLGWRE